MRKKIAFIAPIGEGGPKTLYRDIVYSLTELHPEYEYFLVSSATEWMKLHFHNEKYDLIISSLPFFWKPPQCSYIIQQHGLYRSDRGFTSIPKLLNWLYPYNTIFSKTVLYPSEFLKKYYRSNHNNQQVILNFSSFPIIQHHPENLVTKDTIHLLTIFRADIYDKAIGILDIYEKIKIYHPNKKINYRIAGFGKYYDEMKEKFDTSKLDKNINIEWIGGLNKEGVIEEIRHCDIFLYSTFYETFGIILLEVLSLGKPILLNNYPSYYGLYNDEFISKDTIDFVDKLDKLINDSAYHKNYLEKGYENLKDFDKEQIIEEWHNLIKTQL